MIRRLSDKKINI